MSIDQQDPTIARVKDLEQALLATKHLLAKASAERDAATTELERTRADLVRVTEGRNAAKDARRALEFELQLVRDGGTEVVEDLKRVAEALDAAEVPKVALVGGARLTLAERVRLLDCRAEVAELRRTVDAALVDHSAVESARADLAREVGALKAQLAALSAEHEDAAKAVEAKDGRLADALSGLLEAAEQRAAGIQLPAEEWFAIRDCARAALAEVTP